MHVGWVIGSYISFFLPCGSGQSPGVYLFSLTLVMCIHSDPSSVGDVTLLVLTVLANSQLSSNMLLYRIV